MKMFHERDRAELSILFPHARIDAPVQIGDHTRIWQAHVMRLARIGSECVIGDGVHIGPEVTVERGCKIQNGAQLFKGVTLEQDVFVGPHVVFTNVLTPRAFIDRKTEFRPTVVKRGASIGANATILCGITIGEYAMIGAGSVVTKNVAPYNLVYGNPAIPRSFVCRCGVRLPLFDPRGTGEVPCPACGAVYFYTPAEGLRAKARP